MSKHLSGLPSSTENSRIYHYVLQAYTILINRKRVHVRILLFYQFYYRKSGSAFYIVREVRSVRVGGSGKKRGVATAH